MISSIRSRFVFTIGANLFRSLLSFSTGMLLARWLGPESYGNMAFLLGSFLAIGQLLDMGSSSAFFTFLSQKPQSKRFVRSFLMWLIVQFAIPLVVVGLLFPTEWVALIWHGESRGLVLLAFSAAFMQNSVWPVVQQAGESNRQTQWVQGAGVAVMGAHLLAVALLWRFGLLGLYAVFIAIAIEYFLAALVTHSRYVYQTEAEGGADQVTPNLMLSKYFRYCIPLVPYSLLSFCYAFADRWLLQRYGGGVEQAYYAVGAQFGSVALIATSSILRIFWKEVAESHHSGDKARTGVLYQKVSRLLFLIGAAIAGFLIPWTPELLRLMLGAAYVGGATTLAIMFLYPVHQSMGQIGGTMLYATERVAIQVMVGSISMILSIGITYLVLAPRGAEWPGLGMGSEGLAIKMVGMQWISVNVLALVIARIWGWPFDWLFQPVSLLGCLTLGWISKSLVVTMLGRDAAPIIAIGLSGLCYLLFFVLFVYWLPGLAGLTRAELLADGERARVWLLKRLRP